MSSNKIARRQPVPGVQQGDEITRPSKIPGPLRFPLIATLSLTISALLYSATAELAGGELGRVSRRLDRWDEVGVLVGWRILELAVGFLGNYDGYDLVSLTLLGRGPSVYSSYTWPFALWDSS